MKMRFILFVCMVSILSLGYTGAIYSLDYNPDVDNHAQRINEYLLKNPSNEALMIKAFSKKLANYSEEKRQEITYYSELLSKVHRRNYASCISKKLDPDDSMYWQSSKYQKELLKYASDKKYSIKSNFCTFSSSTTVNCSNVVLDTAKYTQGSIYKDTLTSLGVTSLVDISIDQIVDRYSFVASYDVFCQKQNTRYMFSDDVLIKNIEKVIEAIKLMRANKWAQVNGSLFLPKGNFVSYYIGERVVGNGKIIAVLEGQDPLDLRLYYLTFNNKVSLKRALQPIVGIRAGTNSQDGVGLYNFTDKLLSKDEFTLSYDTDKKPIMTVDSDSVIPSKKMKQYMLLILEGKIKNKAFDKALKELIK